MKRSVVFVGLVYLIVMLLPACAPAPEPEPEPEATPEPTVDLQAEEAAIREIIKRNIEALNNKDLETILSLLAEDFVVHPPNIPPQVGREPRRAPLEGYFKILVSEDWEITKIEISSSGDMAYVLGSFQRIIERDEGQVEDAGKYANVFKKVDDEWKYAFLSFSSNKPTS